MKRNSIFFHIK